MQKKLKRNSTPVGHRTGIVLSVGISDHLSHMKRRSLCSFIGGTKQLCYSKQADQTDNKIILLYICLSKSNKSDVLF